MSRRTITALVVGAAVCVLLLPRAAVAAEPGPEAEAIRAATAELWGVRNGAKPTRFPKALKAAGRELAPCRSKGKGWQRVRKVKNPTQRAAYRRAARLLWRDLSALAAQRARNRVLRPAFLRFLARVERLGVTDPVLVAGIAAQRRRLVAQDALVPLASCATFERRLRRVRGFRSGGDSQAEIDARIGTIYNSIGRYVANKRLRGEGGYADALEAAHDRLLVLGLTDSDATAFQYALFLDG